MSCADRDFLEKPPSSIKAAYKVYQKISPQDLVGDLDILDLKKIPGTGNEKVKRLYTIPSTEVDKVCAQFVSQDQDESSEQVTDVIVYEHEDLPGLHFLPSLFPQKIQCHLLSCLLHRDLANPKHRTNLHLHHHIPFDALKSDVTQSFDSDENVEPYVKSFFTLSPDVSVSLLPISHQLHQPLSISQFLNRKLRWMTLGGQYDWTKKSYPTDEAPEFPSDIGKLTAGLFPKMKPEAAIVNVYTPGDTLSIHRDISEDSENGLVSISLGCDGIFVAGLSDKLANSTKPIAVRLRSGDAIYMSGRSRFAWHGVPKVLADTCPPWLKDWPATNPYTQKINVFEAWRGWMSTKRVNLNIRQMKA